MSPNRNTLCYICITTRTHLVRYTNIYICFDGESNPEPQDNRQMILTAPQKRPISDAYTKDVLSDGRKNCYLFYQIEHVV